MRDLTSDVRHLAINTATIKQWPLEKVIEGCYRRGIRSVTPWRDGVQQAGVATARSWFRDAGIQVSGYCRAGFFPSSDAAERQRIADDNARTLEEAAELGASGVALVVGGLPAGSKDLAAARGQVEAGIAELLERATQLRMPLLIEPLHPVYAADRACVNSLGQALDICDRIDPDHGGYLGIAFDVYHLWWNPALEAQIERAGRRRLRAFHVCDWLVPTRDLLNDRGMMGDGVIDIPLIRSWVERTGYDGPCEVEIFSADDWWKRDGDDVLDTCVRRYQSAV